MSDTSPTGSPAGTPNEAYRLSATQQAALTAELRRYADSIADTQVHPGDPLQYPDGGQTSDEEIDRIWGRITQSNAATLLSSRRYTNLADVIERTGELEPRTLPSHELAVVTQMSGWDDPREEVQGELREIAAVALAARRAAAQLEHSLEQAPAGEVRSILEIAEALTFGVAGGTSDANNARASAAAWAIAAAPEGQAPFGGRQVVDHGGDLAAAVDSPEFWDALKSEELGPEDQGGNAVATVRAYILADLDERGALTVAQGEPARTVDERDYAAPAREEPLEQSTEAERLEQSESGPRSVLDRIRAKLHLDSEARAERLSAVGITFRPQETSTVATHERAQALQPRAYGLEDTAR
jgi:hypothetical protein